MSHLNFLQGKGNSTKIPISLSKGGSDYPREVLESFLLAAKESASELQVEYFAEVSQIKLKANQAVHQSRVGAVVSLGYWLPFAMAAALILGQ